MATITLDRAYCRETDSELTIYQVRDLHFDENETFDSLKAYFKCPDKDCDAPFVGVNCAKVKFKNTPHFRLLIDHKHSEACDYGGESSKKISEKSKGKGTERSYKVSNYPEVLLLERQPVPRNTGKPKKRRKTSNSSTTSDASPSNSGNSSPYTTSCLESVVETWVSNSEEDLRHSLLTIGDKTKYYRNFFKKIEYFTDEEGLIYWGNVKLPIKPYGKGYSIIFKKRPKFEGENRQISIYIRNEQIERYRKRKLFRQYIESLIDHPGRDVTCYFVGAYPKLKDKDVESSRGSFRPLEIHLKNLDHLVLRFNEDSEDL